MGREYVLRRVQRFAIPRERVFAFFADAHNLEAITPPFLNFHVVTPTPIDMRAGTLIDYHLRLFGVPFRWRTEIESFDAPRRFVDRQLCGPYALWHHTHTFETVAASRDGEPEQTEMTDVVRYRLPLGPLGWAAHALFVRRTLRRIFDYRAEKIRELLGA